MGLQPYEPSITAIRRLQTAPPTANLRLLNFIRVKQQSYLGKKLPFDD